MSGVGIRILESYYWKVTEIVTRECAGSNCYGISGGGDKGLSSEYM